MKLLLLACVSGLVLPFGGCEHKSNEQSEKPAREHDAPVTITATPTPHQTATPGLRETISGPIGPTDSWKHPMTVLQSACEQHDNAVFDARKMECVCDETAENVPQVFGVKKDWHGCLPAMRYKPTSIGNEAAFESWQQLYTQKGRDEVIQRLARGVAHNNVAVRIKIDSASLSEDDLKDLLKTLDSDPYGAFVRLPHAYQKFEPIDIKYKPQALSDVDANLFLSQPFVDVEDPDHLNNVDTLIASDSDNLLAVMGRRKFEIEAWRFPNQTASDAGDATIEALHQGIRKMNEIEILGHAAYDKDSVTVYDTACDVKCALIREFRIEGIAGRFWKEKLIQRGATRKETLFYSLSGDETVDGMVILGLGRNASVIVTVDHKSTPINGLENRVRIYDFQLRKLYDKTKFLFSKFQKAAEVISNQIKNPQQENDIPVLVCEGAYDFSDNVINQSLLIGPHASGQASKGSLLGWLENPTGALGQTWDGLTKEFWGEETQTSSVRHGINVSRLLLQDSRPKTRLVLSRSQTCLRRPDLVREITTKAKIKIANLSATMNLDAGYCQGSIGLENSILWVTGAGNAGVENPQRRCPQVNAVFGNVLVVAATQGGFDLAAYSDFGTTYADIAASGQGFHTGAGTSFAAPRVTATLADILSETSLQTLSTTELRYAILLSADVPGGANDFRPLAVRSGGVLNPLGAKVISRLIAGLDGGLNSTERIVLSSGRRDDKFVVMQKLVTRLFPQESIQKIKSRIQFLKGNQL